MIKRSLFFFYDRLQITAAERKLIYVFSGLLIILTLSQPFVQPLTAIDESTYAPIKQAFEERSMELRESQAVLKTQYYPDASDNRDTIRETDALPKLQTNTIATQNTTIDANPVVTQKKITQSAISDGLININTADAKELTKLPGIGPAISARIVEYRNEFGPFKTIEDIKKVRGIGPARFEAIKELITVTSDK